jgi:hypothetical protein
MISAGFTAHSMYHTDVAHRVSCEGNSWVSRLVALCCGKSGKQLTWRCACPFLCNNINSIWSVRRYVTGRYSLRTFWLLYPLSYVSERFGLRGRSGNIKVVICMAVPSLLAKRAGERSGRSWNIKVVIYMAVSSLLANKAGERSGNIKVVICLAVTSLLAKRAGERSGRSWNIKVVIYMAVSSLLAKRAGERSGNIKVVICLAVPSLLAKRAGERSGRSSSGWSDKMCWYFRAIRCCCCHAYWCRTLPTHLLLSLTQDKTSDSLASPTRSRRSLVIAYVGHWYRARHESEVRVHMSFYSHCSYHPLRRCLRLQNWAL